MVWFQHRLRWTVLQAWQAVMFSWLSRVCCQCKCRKQWKAKNFLHLSVCVWVCMLACTCLCVYICTLCAQTLLLQAHNWRLNCHFWIWTTLKLLQVLPLAYPKISMDDRYGHFWGCIFYKHGIFSPLDQLKMKTVLPERPFYLMTDIYQLPFLSKSQRFTDIYNIYNAQATITSNHV